jgi:hypothetical protein
VECRTPLATLRHLFLTPARKFEGKKNWSKITILEQKQIGERKTNFLGRCRIPSQNVALKNLNAT